MPEPIVLPSPPPSRGERNLLLAVFAAFAIWVFLPPVLQDPAYHAFADQRAWLGIPGAADVISNVPFLLVGAFGLARLASARRRKFGPATEASLWCAAVGFVCTAAGSMWYHLDPDDARLEPISNSLNYETGRLQS
jgi:hypothetical protein